MTDLQVRYNQLKETERANRASEELRAKEIATREREATVSELEQAMRERKLPYEITDLMKSAELKDAQKIQVGENILKIQAEVENIKADTQLTQLEKIEKISHMVKGFMNQMENVLYWFTGGQIQDIFAGLLDSFAGGIANGLGSGFGGSLIG